MKQVAKNILTALMGAAILTGCSTDEQEQVLQGNTLAISVGTNGTLTRALVTGNTLDSGSSIGVAVTDADGNPYDGQSDYALMEWTANGSGSAQEWTSDTKVLLSANNAKVYAYYPYSGAVTDITAIPVNAAEQIDYMVASEVSGVSATTPSAQLTLNHVMTAVRLNVVKGTYTGAGVVTAVKVKGAPLGTSGTLNARTGEFTAVGGVILMSPSA